MGSDQRLDVSIARLEEQVKSLALLVRDLQTEFVPRSEFEPVKKLCYGVVWAIVLAVLASALGRVIVAQ